MGLAGRKIKQRIGADPRNLTWSDDSSRFGAKYLQSLGWSSGSGLGVSGEGRASAIKIHQKLDLMGIGANRRGPGGDDAGWRGSREFEGLLARLNQSQTQRVEAISTNKDITPEDGHEGNHASHEADKETDKRKEEKERKRKRESEADEEVDRKEAKRRRKEEKRERKAVEKAAKNKGRNPVDETHTPVDAEVTKFSSTIAGGPVEPEPSVKPAPRHRAHRARHLASKRLASASSTGINEILGIAPSKLPEKAAEVSSIPFPTRATPPRQPSTKGNNVDAAPIHTLTQIKEQSVQCSDGRTDLGSTMGLGFRSDYGAGLGFNSSKTENNTTDTKEESSNDLLRKSGKSVAEYFAEKMKMKNTTKDASCPMEPRVEIVEVSKRKKKERKERK